MSREKSRIIFEYAHPEALATTEWVAEHLCEPSVRLIDSRKPPSRVAYEAGHIPGAVYMDAMADLSDPESNIPSRIIPPDSFEKVMGRLGINNGTSVVIYDASGGLWAARFWWALRYYGHDAVKILNGGLTKWIVEDRPLETGMITLDPTTFSVHIRHELRATSEDVRQAIGCPDVCIIDALPEEYYTGIVPILATHRAGHIPMARNLPAPVNIHLVTETLLPLDNLVQIWRKVDLKPDQRAITYCGAGFYGAFDLFVLYQLGHESVSLYDASWMEWGANPDLPVETGSG